MAIRGLDTAASGLAAYSEQIAVVGNNLANIQTAAFKRSEVRFQDILYEMVQVPGKEDIGGETGLGVEFGRGVAIASIPTIYQQGSFIPGLDLDVAINGEGFFRVRDLDGNVFYTRLGAFQPKGAGAAGPLNLQVAGRTLLLDPPIVLPGNNALATVNGSGVLTQGAFAAQITLHRIQNVDGLEQVGDLLFRETAASGTVTSGIPGTSGFGSLIDQTLESSNVDLSNELVFLIQASQAFSLNSQTFVTGNEEIRQMIALVQQA